MLQLTHTPIQIHLFNQSTQAILTTNDGCVVLHNIVLNKEIQKLKISSSKLWCLDGLGYNFVVGDSEGNLEVLGENNEENKKELL